MKKLFISIAIALFLIAGCSGNQTKEQEQSKEVHTHDDGSIHENHEEDSTTKQEEFTVPMDTPSKKEEPKHEHTHDGKDGHEHPHKH